MKKLLLLLPLLLSNSCSLSTMIQVSTIIKENKHKTKFEPVVVELKKSAEIVYGFDSKQMKLIFYPSITPVIYIDTQKNEMVEELDPTNENILTIDSSKFFGFEIYLDEAGSEKIICNPMVLAMPCTIKVPYKNLAIKFIFTEVQ